MIHRLNAILNFICTYEKVITINKTIIDVIDEFNIEDGRVVLYGYNVSKMYICP